MIYFTGCTHYGHENIIKYAGRPFKNANEMDSALIDNYNKVVKSEDLVYHLGDFVWKGVNPELIKQKLNGRIEFIQGNHDRKNTGPDLFNLTYKGKFFVLLHYPLEDWNGKFHGSMMIHCHTHKKELFSAPGRFNVGVDATNFTPISIEEILSSDNKFERP